MIEDLRATALLGSSRESTPRVETGAEIDDLLASIVPGDRERGLLLTAGALAVWQRAGYCPAPAPELEKAPADTLSGCSDGVAEILRTMIRSGNRQLALRHTLDWDMPRVQTGLLGEHDDLLVEALTLLRESGLRLRYYLLPDLLPARSREVRAALRPVIGERGRWVAGFNPTWVWAADTLPAHADWLWQKGKTEYRVDLLELQRRIDPAGARARLETRFFSDRAEVRLTLLQALETGLSQDDEPLLERVLDAGTPAVSARAARLLARLPQSACADRLRERADTMLIWRSGRLSRHRLQVNLPSSLDPGWRREGLQPHGGLPDLDAPGGWMMQTVGLIPVRHWLDRFGTSLETLIARLDGDRALQVLEAWTHAAVYHDERDLLPVLWDAWWERRTQPVRAAYLRATLWSELAGAMDSSTLGERLARLLADPPEPEILCGRVLEAVPWPWPEAAGDAFLRMLRMLARHLATAEAPPKPWLYTLLPGARGIPAGCIEPALALLSSLPTIDASLDQWQQVLDVVTEKLRIRQHLIQELGR